MPKGIQKPAYAMLYMRNGEHGNQLSNSKVEDHYSF